MPPPAPILPQDKCAKIGKWADSQDATLKGLVQQPKNVGTATKNQTTAQKMRPEFYKKKKELDEMVVTEGNELTKVHEPRPLPPSPARATAIALRLIPYMPWNSTSSFSSTDRARLCLPSRSAVGGANGACRKPRQY